MLNLTRANPIGDEEKAAVQSVLDSGVLSDFIGADCLEFYGGERVRQLEGKAKLFFNSPFAVSVNSWTSGLICAFGAIGICPGDEVIVPSWTMSATVTSILVWGGIPVFADISDINYCLDVDNVAKLITRKTKAVALVDIFGYSPDHSPFIKLCTKYNLRLISDCAQSPWSFSSGQHTVNSADVSGISLNYHKHIHCGEGGIIFCKDRDLYERLALIRNHGENLGFNHLDITNIVGFNFRLGEIEAAIASCQLDKLPSRVERKQHEALLILRSIEHLPGLRIPSVEDIARNSFYTLPIQIMNNSYCRETLYNELCKIHHKLFVKGYILVHRLPMYRDHIAFGNHNYPWSLGKNQSLYNFDVVESRLKTSCELHDSTLINILLTHYDFSDDNLTSLCKLLPLAFYKARQS
jgi:perosamine synthetase